MGKVFWWVAGTIVFLVLLLVLYLAWPLGGSSKEEMTKVQTALSQEKAKVVKAEAALRLKNAELDSLAKNCPPKPVVVPVTPPAKQGKSQQQGTQGGNSPQKVIIEIRDLRTGAGASGTVGVTGNNGTTKSAKISNQAGGTGGEAEYNVNEIQAQRTNIVVDKKATPLCMQFGDGTEAQFWPHLAILDQELFPEAVDNHHDGYNLMLMPSGSLENVDPSKDYGITEDKISWVRASRVAKWSNMPMYMMVSSGKFRPVELYNGLYIAK